METQKKSNKSLLAGILAAFAASLCCITPVLALLGGVGGLAASLSWLDPFRPYFMAMTILVFGFAWYQKLKPKTAAVDDCGCEVDEKQSFLQSKKFLGIITVIAGLLLAFPHYSGVFFPDSNTAIIVSDENNIVEATISINGMTCTGCEHHVNNALNQSAGVIEASSSFENGEAKVKFDKTKVDVESLANAIARETGYEVTDHTILN